MISGKQSVFLSRYVAYSTCHHEGVRRLLLGLVAISIAIPVWAVNDAYLPFVESLEAAQERGYVQAAPQGRDDDIRDLSQSLGVIASAVDPSAVDPSAMDTREASTLEQMAEAKSGPLSLEETQQSQVLHSDLIQFGYDIFAQTPNNLAPLAGIPVPANYRIGPGDNIIVQLFGKRNVEYKLVVTRDGSILVPEYGPVKVAGLTFDEAEGLISEGFQRRVIGARTVVTMGQLRTLQIRLAGDVVHPGVFTVGGLSTMIDALLATGGIRPTGSLRRIELIRGGKRVALLDFYDLLLRGRISDELYLEHNDTIFVPPIGPIVYVGGDVQRPAIYELRDEQTVADVIAMSGGLLPTASLKDSHIERIQSGGSRTLLDFSSVESGGDKVILATRVRTGDLLRVLPLEDELADVVLFTGHVKRPGGYQYRSGMRVSDVVSSVDVLLPGADVDFLLIKRESPKTLRIETIYINLLDVLSSPGGAADVPLQSRDQLFAFNLADDRESAVTSIVRKLDIQATQSRPARVVEVRGATRFNGRLPLQDGARLVDITHMAGGLLPGAELYYGVLARTLYPGTEIKVIAFNLAAALASPSSDANLVVESGDRLYFFDEKANRSELMSDEIYRLRQQSSFGADERLVVVQGEVLNAGTYPLVKGMRASDLLCAARGLSHKASGVSAELSRVVHDAESGNTIQHIALDSRHLLNICGQYRRQSSIANVSEAPVAIDDVSDPVLQPLDQLTFTEKSGWVEQATVILAGEIERPGVYAINRGETLCEVLERANGLTPDAYSFGAQFSRRSVRAMQQETLDELHDQLDDLMIELSLSQGFNKEQKAPAEWGGKQDYLKAIRQLEKATANGRMVINLEKAVVCKKKDKLVLEDGDVLTVPSMPDYVQVSGQVYVPTSHFYDEDRDIGDYVDMSGGHTVLGRLKDTYVIQANGEVLNYRGSRTSSRITSRSVMPGARIYVPLDVDRMNTTESAQSWVDILVRSAILAGLVL
jgi:polysaccharide export outer membrane protein